MAITTTQYRIMRDQMNLLLGGPFYQVADADALSFFYQLLIDAALATPLSATLQLSCTTYLQGVLSGGKFAGSAQNVADFFSQIQTDSASVGTTVGTLQAVRYQNLKNQLTGALSVAGVRTEAQMLGYVGGFTFTGNFAGLFTGVIQSVQTDLGFTYGTTPFPTSGNTSATVMTLGGTITGTPVPVLVKATNTATVGSGALFSIYYDGGTTPAMTSVALTTTPTALTGAGAGLTLAATAASSVTNDTWKATCQTLADQSGGGFNFTQAVVTKQPIVTVGLNGKPGLLFDGIDDFFASSINLPAPGTTPTYMFSVFRIVTWTINNEVFSCTNFAHGHQIIMATSSPGLAATNGTQSSTVNTLAIGTFGCVEAYYSNSTSDFVRVGTDSDHTGTNLGNTASTGRWIAQSESATFAKIELLAQVLTNTLPSAGTRASARSAVTSFYGGLVNV